MPGAAEESGRNPRFVARRFASSSAFKASASFSPTSVPGSGSTQLTLTPSQSTPSGAYPLTITGTSGSLVHTTSVTLTIGGAPTTTSVSSNSQPSVYGSGVTFTGDTSGNVMALRTADGATLWHAAIGRVGNSPVTYELDGRQYVLVGGGSALYAFALPKPPVQPTSTGAATETQRHRGIY